MKIKRPLGVLAIVLSVIALNANSVLPSAPSASRSYASGQPEPTRALQGPVRDLAIPGVPDKGDCCLWQIERTVQGKREARYGSQYPCDAGPTARGEMTLTMKLKLGGRPCDQEDIPANDSTLEARGTILRRGDQYAYFSGEFSINDPTGKALFKGRIETTDRLGSHHLASTCEKCNPPSHFEGWLVGRGVDSLARYSLRAFVVARGTVPSPRSPSMILTGSVSGTLIKCP